MAMASFLLVSEDLLEAGWAGPWILAPMDESDQHPSLQLARLRAWVA
jgi:hypothetical protein